MTIHEIHLHTVIDSNYYKRACMRLFMRKADAALNALTNSDTHYVPKKLRNDEEFFKDLVSQKIESGRLFHLVGQFSYQIKNSSYLMIRAIQRSDYCYSLCTQNLRADLEFNIKLIKCIGFKKYRENVKPNPKLLYELIQIDPAYILAIPFFYTYRDDALLKHNWYNEAILKHDPYSYCHELRKYLNSFTFFDWYSLTPSDQAEELQEIRNRLYQENRTFRAKFLQQTLEEELPTQPEKSIKKKINKI